MKTIVHAHIQTTCVCVCVCVCVCDNDVLGKGVLLLLGKKKSRRYHDMRKKAQCY